MEYVEGGEMFDYIVTKGRVRSFDRIQRLLLIYGLCAAARGRGKESVSAIDLRWDIQFMRVAIQI